MMQQLPPGFVIDGQPAQGNTIITKRADPRDARSKELENAIKELTVAGKQSDLRMEPVLKNAQLTNAQNQQPNEQFNQRDKLRADWEGLAPVKEYRAAISALAQALNTSPDAGGDNALIYAYAKIMDPGSVVRESEMDMAGAADTKVGALAARFAKEFGLDGGGQLSPEVRQKLRREAINSVAQRVKIYDNQRDRFSEYAKRNNYDPFDIVGPHDGLPFVEQFKEYDGADKIVDQVAKGAAFAKSGANIKTGNNGFDKYVTEEDSQRTGTLQAVYENPNSTPEQLNAVARQLGLQEFAPEQLKTLYDAKAQGERVRIKPNATGERGLGQQLLGAVADTGLGAYGIAAGNAVTLGGLDEIVGATQGERAGQLAQYGKEYAREQSPIASLAGDVTGGVMLGGPASAGVRMAGIKGIQSASPFVAKMANAFAGSVPRAAITASTAQGALTGAGEMNDNRLLGAGIGGGAGLVGSAAGAKLASLPYTGTATNLTNPVRGMFGGRQRPTLPALSPAQQLMNKSVGGNFDNAISQMDEAGNFGLPMTLADADPALRSLAGSTVRKSPDARGIAEQTLIPRQRGQYDRLIGAIDRDLGPIANVPQLSDDLIKKARADAGPLYDQAYSAPGASSVDISGIIKTPIGQQGLQRAGARVQNQLGPDGQPIDPTSLGFDFNDAGETMLTRTPSFQQLDQFKQGLDDVINAGYDPISRQYTPEAAQAIDLKNRLVSQIDSVNPAYKDARAAYAGPAADRAALQQGKDALRLPPDAMNFQRQALGTSEQAQYGLGYRSGMAEQAGKTRYAANPWETAYGTPQAQQKVGALFPEGADRFGRQYGLESQMAQTNNAVIGGSPTAERLISDSNFDLGFLPTAAMDVATTGTPMMTSARLGAKFAGGELGRIGAKKKADALAPILFNADPAQNAAVIRELQKTIKVQKRGKGMFGNRARKLGALAGGAPSVGFTLGLTE